MKIKETLNKRRRGVIPLLAIAFVIFIPVLLWLAWQFAKILIGETKEKV